MCCLVVVVVVVVGTAVVAVAVAIVVPSSLSLWFLNWANRSCLRCLAAFASANTACGLRLVAAADDEDDEELPVVVDLLGVAGFRVGELIALCLNVIRLKSTSISKSS